MHILIIDDDAQIRTALADGLTAMDHDVSTATDGTDALERLTDRLPDLVLCDIQMPGMDGMTFLKAARKQHPKLPIILMTGHETLETAVEALRNRAYDYLKKPVLVEALQVCFERLKIEHGSDSYR